MRPTKPMPGDREPLDLDAIRERAAAKILRLRQEHPRATRDELLRLAFPHYIGEGNFPDDRSPGDAAV